MAKKKVRRPLPASHTGGYTAIPLESVRVESIPSFDVYIRAGAGKPHVLYAERDTPFGQEVLERLLENQVANLYISNRDQRRYQSYLGDHLEDVLDDGALSVKKKTKILYDSALAVVEEFLANPKSREAIERGKKIVRHTVDFMTSKDFLLEEFLRTISCDYYLYTHSVNVVAYSVALAAAAGETDGAALREIANGALMHDVGKTTIDRVTRNKRGELNEREWDEMHGHPQVGYDMLVEAGHVGEIALSIVLEHHERLDGSGYPKGLSGDNISWYVRVVSIADVFDALTTDRYHHAGHSTFKAITMMTQEMRDGLDDDLLKLFIEVMGLRT